MENIVLYDYLSFTSKIHSIADILELLGLSSVSWQDTKGAHGYQNRLYYDCISIHYNGSEDMGIWIELTGQGCRAFETYGNGDYEAIFSMILENPQQMNLTRLDVAFDDHDGILDINELCHDTRNLNFVSRFNDWQVTEGNKGASVLHGSFKSEILIRIYDKAKERGCTDDTHWIRVELQLRRDRAIGFIKQTGDIGQRFRGVLLGYLRYIENSENDSNKWRSEMRDYWLNLCECAAKISLYQKPGTEYNICKLEDFVFKQAGNAIHAAVEILGKEQFFERLRKRETMPNEKYINLINESRTRREKTEKDSSYYRADS